MFPVIRPVFTGIRVAGAAFTVKCLPGDMTAAVLAIYEAKPGDILVIDAGGTDRSMIWGGISGLAAKIRGIGGCVTNGAVRDVEELESIGFPVFAATVSVRGIVRNHSGWRRIPISVGGTAAS